MPCNVCPRRCNINRSDGNGMCGVGDKIRIARAAEHFWEEPCISGDRGSGTVFFSGCSLKCVFCQNFDISHGAFGAEISETRLAEIFDELIALGVHNLNLVTPTHYAPVIARVLERYNSPVPVVYNSSGYENVDTLKMLEGLVDIYLPDVKYYDSKVSAKYSGAADYFEAASAAVLEMSRQCGELSLDDNGIAKSGVIIRHLLLPGNVSQAYKVFGWVKENLPAGTGVSLMRQYTPYGKAKDMPPLDRVLSSKEYALAKERILSLGFENCYFQLARAASEEYIPPFDLTGV